MMSYSTFAAYNGTFRKLFALVATVVLCLVVGLLLVNVPISRTATAAYEKVKQFGQVYAATNDDVNRLRAQRNELSKLLNAALEKKGQLECDMLKDGSKNKERVVASSGAWCNANDLVKHHMHDKPLAEQLAKELTGKTIGSFGDGSGTYPKLLKKSGSIALYHSYDGNPYSYNATNGTVFFLDLSVPHYELPMYDWVISLEVAEHIPAAFESVYLDNLVRFAKEGVILSWAVVGQGGRAHVNNRPDEYVRASMLSRGLSRDEDMS